ncbi:NCS2 family permease, partial [candidate division KSB1 bacterium]
MLDKFFSLKRAGTSVSTELRAGLTTFMTMAYIIFVQPQVLSAAGMDLGAVMMATCISAAFATILMGLLTNYPIAQAPGMGENFFFTYTVVLTMGLSWQAALGSVFIAGVVFVLIVLLIMVLGIRDKVVGAIPDTLKHSIAVGIGILIAFIGMTNAGIVVKSPGGILELGDLKAAPTLLALFGLGLTAYLRVRRVRGFILWGLLATAVMGLITGVIHYPGRLVSLPPSLAPTFLQMDLPAAFSLAALNAVLVFLTLDIFDTLGTLIGVSEQAGLMKNGDLPGADKALMADALGTVVGATLGTSTVTSYIESSAGVQEGGRTGLTNLVVGLLFVVAIFFYPLVRMIGAGIPGTNGAMLYPVTASALIIIGTLIMTG